jgi:hypothetical protein
MLAVGICWGLIMRHGVLTRRHGLQTVLSGVAACLLAIPATANAAPANLPLTQGPDSPTSLIIRFAPNVEVRIGGRVPGARGIASPQRMHMRVGVGLGERMYRIDFTKDVTPAQATRVARQLAKQPQVLFAQLDTVASGQIVRGAA